MHTRFGILIQSSVVALSIRLTQRRLFGARAARAPNLGVLLLALAAFLCAGEPVMAQTALPTFAPPTQAAKSGTASPPPSAAASSPAKPAQAPGNAAAPPTPARPLTANPPQGGSANDGKKSPAPIQNQGFQVLSVRVNINTASEAQLDDMPQIGKARAKVIMDLRAKAPFRNYDDFDTRTKGTSINEEVKAKIKDWIDF